MRWDERQRAMLREIGIHSWWPADDDGVATAVPEAESAVAGARARAPAGSSAAPVSATAFAPANAPTAAPTAALTAAPTAASVRESSRAADPVPGSVAASDAADGLDWTALRATVAACNACGLGANRRQAVFGAGSERAHWMVVGEVPGEPEDAGGEPFAGRSGQLLDNMLRAIGLTRGAAEPARQVFVAHTLKCRPPGDRNPTPPELAQCENFLARQVQLVQPRIILAMGAFAVRSLLGSTEPMGRLRGHVHRYRGVPVIVTYDPAYLLRNGIDKAKAWDDLCLAVETLATADAARAAAP